MFPVKQLFHSGPRDAFFRYWWMADWEKVQEEMVLYQQERLGRARLGQESARLVSSSEGGPTSAGHRLRKLMLALPHLRFTGNQASDGDPFVPTDPTCGDAFGAMPLEMRPPCASLSLER